MKISAKEEEEEEEDSEGKKNSEWIFLNNFYSLLLMCYGEVNWQTCSIVVTEQLNIINIYFLFSLIV